MTTADPFATVSPAMKQTNLSSQLFLTLHDPFTGKPEVSQQLLECGVSAAQLAELIIARRLEVIDDHVVPAGQGAPGPVDEIGEYVLRCVAEQSTTHAVRAWVTSLGEAVTDLVARELINAGVVQHLRPRGLLGGRKPDRFPATDLLRASSARNRLRDMLAHPDKFDLPSAALAAIVAGLGAQRVFEVEDSRDVFKELNRYLPAALRPVLAGLATAVAAVSVGLGGR